MRKLVLSTALLAGALLLAGAGCSWFGAPATSPTPTSTNPTPTSSENGTTPATGDFQINAEVTATKTVKVTWTKPSDMAEGSTLRLIHSRIDNPSFPANEGEPSPYWYQPSRTQTELVWSSIPTGTRYFRACEYNDDKCLRYSNTVKLEIE